MQVVHKNITIEYCDINTDFTGEVEAQIPLNIWKKYNNYHKGKIPYSNDIFSKYDKTSEYKNIQSADVLICFYYWVLHTYEKDIRLKVRYDHISWVYHDLMHSENDCDEYSINVYSKAERNAILHGLQKAYDNHKEVLSFEDLETVCEQYNERFFRDGFGKPKLYAEDIFSSIYADLMEVEKDE